MSAGNGKAVNMIGIGIGNLKLTSGKTLILHNMQHAPEIRRNLISGSLLVQLRYKIVLESNKVVISREKCLLKNILYLTVYSN